MERTISNQIQSGGYTEKGRIVRLKTADGTMFSAPYYGVSVGYVISGNTMRIQSIRHEGVDAHHEKELILSSGLLKRVLEIAEKEKFTILVSTELLKDALEEERSAIGFDGRVDIIYSFVGGFRH